MKISKIDLTNLTEEQQEDLKDLIVQQVSKRKSTPTLRSEEEKKRIKSEWLEKGITPPEFRKLSDWLNEESISNKEIERRIMVARFYNNRGWRKPINYWVANVDGSVYSTGVPYKRHWFIFRRDITDKPPRHRVERTPDGWKITYKHHVKCNDNVYYSTWEEAAKNCDLFTPVGLTTKRPKFHPLFG